MKQKKNLMILLLIAVMGIVGVTIAYFSSQATFENVFETPEYGTEYIEKFTSPDNWLPGDETEKTLEVRNSGDVDEAVRVKVEESWVSQNGTTLPLKQGDNVAALINFINDDDWTKVTVDGEDYYYYYYNYKLAPGETTSKLLDKVTFNPLINASTTCSDTVVDGVLKRTCNSDGGGYDGATYTLKFTIETVQYNKYSEAWNTNIIIKEERPHPGTLTLLEKTNPVSVTNYTDGDIHEMYTFEHGATAQTPALTDYRYIGNDPYNYVYFNCDDLNNQTSETCEVWRIIGVFDVEREVDDEDNPGERKTITETRMKLVRGNCFETSMSFDTKDRYGKNDWTTADLQYFLNSSFLKNEELDDDYGIKKTSQDMIDNTKYYLGTVPYKSDFGNAEDLYTWERGNELCFDCNNDETKLTWQGKVALLYPSDMYMVYANGFDDSCYISPNSCDKYNDTVLHHNAGWLYDSNRKPSDSRYPVGSWFISGVADSTTLSFYLQGSGSLRTIGLGSASARIGVRPVVYLSASVKIIDGDGSSRNPYKLK